VVTSAEPGRSNTKLGEGKPEMDIGWQLPYALCEGSQSQDGMRLVI
jgi:hypothetical protein